MREKFYIFLDIDGVMFDWKYRLSSGKKLGGIIKDFNPESVNALNFLCQTLSAKFDTNVIITSTWKQHWQDLLETFDKNGVNFNNITLDKTITRGNPKFRSREILEYLGADTNNCKFVIIDDEMFDYQEHFSHLDIIKTNMQDDSLNIDKVTTYLKAHNIEFEQDKVM